MTKRIISLIMAIVFIVCLVPASAFSAFAEATVIETKWSNGAVGGPTNSNKYKFISNANYRTSDIITIEKRAPRSIIPRPQRRVSDTLSLLFPYGYSRTASG